MNARTGSLALSVLVPLVAGWQGGQQQKPKPPVDELPADLFPAKAPLGLPAAIPAPEHNPLEQRVFELGRRLFFDPVLSIDRTVSCASCHRPDHAFASVEALPPGVLGRRALRNAPSLYNRAYGKAHRWDGKTKTLEEQVLLPIEDPNEMALPLDTALQRLRTDDAYTSAFGKAFAGDASIQREQLSHALATFVRGLVKADSPVDRFRAGKSNDLTVAEKAGLWLYESKAGCWRCHSGDNFSDEKVHNTGIGARDGRPEPGHFAVTNDEKDLGKFKTPTLRGVANSGPFMHDGSLKTLQEVVEFYKRGGNPNSNLSSDMKPLDLTDEDVQNLVAFLRALSR